MTSVFSLLLFNNIYAQETDKSNFSGRMNNHINRFFSNDASMAKAKEFYGHTCDIYHVVTEEEIMVRAAEAEKHAFIQYNMEEYIKLYFPDQPSGARNTTVSICDNGGFEQDFLYYTGYKSQFLVTKVNRKVTVWYSIGKK